MGNNSSFTLYWKGADLKERTQTASYLELEELLQQCVAYAKSIAPYVTGRYRDGNFDGRTRGQGITYVVRRRGSGVSGSFGSDADHGIWVEIGTVHMPGQHIIRRTADRLAPTLPRRVRSQLVA